jgi:hypothetical protein
MTKFETISKTLAENGLASLEGNHTHSTDPDDQDPMMWELQWTLPSDMDIKTCADFRHLNVECCQTCHELPHYDMSLISLPDGKRAWVCGAVKEALPEILTNSENDAGLSSFVL